MKLKNVKKRRARISGGGYKGVRSRVLEVWKNGGGQGSRSTSERDWSGWFCRLSKLVRGAGINSYIAFFNNI